MSDDKAVLDPRRHAYRPDLADDALMGKVEAEEFVAAEPRQIIRPAVPLRAQPVPSDGFVTEALFGEQVRWFEDRNGWAWIQLASDGYVGYVPANALSSAVTDTTHRVRSKGTFLYATADIKSPPIMHLGLGAGLTIVESGERFSQTDTSAFVITRHLAGKDKFARDFVEVAERFTGTPYLWGGKSGIGIDCSGLVQLSLQAAGQTAPRDSDMQLAELGTAIELKPDFEGLERGDLVFWKGHVGIMIDGLMLLHANAHHMAVVVETLPEAAGRIAKTGSEIIAVKRLSPSPPASA